MNKQKNKSKRNYVSMESNSTPTKAELLEARAQEVQRDILPGFFTKYKGKNISSISAKARASRISKYS